MKKLFLKTKNFREEVIGQRERQSSFLKNLQSDFGINDLDLMEEEEEVIENGLISLGLDLPNHGNEEGIMIEDSNSAADGDSSNNRVHISMNSLSQSLVSPVYSISSKCNGLNEKNEQFLSFSYRSIREISAKYNLSRACTDEICKVFNSGSQEILGVSLFPKNIYF
jgi:hypothetical protein